MRQYRAYFVPGAMDPEGTTMTKLECREAVKTEMNRPELKEMYNRIKERGCKQISFRCTVCNKDKNDRIGGAAFIPVTGPKNAIRICVNNPKVNKELIYELLRHELVHAIDDCEYANPALSCGLRICSEIRAYSFSNCYDGSPFRKKQDGSPMSRELCIKADTYRSVRDKKGCKDLGKEIIFRRIHDYYKTCAIGNDDAENDRLPCSPYAFGGGAGGY